jgi:general secretion pathway protein K
MNGNRNRSPRARSPGDRGAALLTTLIVVAGLSAIAVSALADMRRDQRLSANAQSTAQAQWFAIGAESYARLMAEDLVSGALPRTALAGPPRTGAFPLDQGMMQVTVRDASTCINANGVVSGAGDVYEREEAGVAQVVALMEMQGLSSAKSTELAEALVEWIDTVGGVVGADDAAYTALAPPYLSGSEPLSEFSELRAIRGFTPDVLEMLRPWLCVLPAVGPSRINLNALTPEQAPVLVAMSGGKITPTQARDLLRRRPATGWQSLGEALSDPAIAAAVIDQRALQALTLDTQYLGIDVIVTHADAEAAMSGLMVRGGNGFVTAARRWTEDR